MRLKCKVKEISDKTTATAIEDYINTQLTKGWVLKEIFTHTNGKLFAVFIKEISG